MKNKTNAKALKGLKAAWISCLAVSLTALILGASFHGLRIHPENVDDYNLGVFMGISMISVFSVFLAAYIALYIVYRKKRNQVEDK